MLAAMPCHASQRQRYIRHDYELRHDTLMPPPWYTLPDADIDEG